jgi:type I restriction-modification system DNA methylase subunit
MVTPERLRRRQRIESALVVIVIVLTCVSTWYTLEKARGTQECLEDTVQDLTNSLQVRSTAANDISTLVSDRVELLETLLNDIANLVVNPAGTEAEQSAKFQELLVNYQTDTAELDVTKTELDDVRKENPYPDYPDGKCD